MPEDSVPGENLLSGLQTAVSSLSSHGRERERERERGRVSALVSLPLLRTLIPSWEPYCYNLI